MSDKVFFDTNILVYAFDKGELRKHKIAFGLVTQGYQTQNAVISAQVLKEFFVTVTQKTAKKMSQKDAEQAVRDFALWTVVETSVTLVIEGIAIHRKQQMSFWDAMIVAAAKESHCPVILSEDMSHDSVIENIRITNPFL
jgi:predicted nucleic acid-binding protein